MASFSTYNAPLSFTSTGNYQQDYDALNQISQQRTTFNGLPASTTAAVQATDRMSQMQQQREVDPWSYYRGGAADKLAGMVGQGSPSEYYSGLLKNMVGGQFNSSDPSYKWRFDQGQQAVERSLAAKGLLNSGNAAIELQEYGQGMASQEYQAQFERLLAAMDGTESAYNKNFGRLADLAGIGNAGLGLGKQQLDQGIADNFNYQQGIAKSMAPSKDVYAGYTFG